jgi:hypothetical protein
MFIRESDNSIPLHGTQSWAKKKLVFLHNVKVVCFL